MEQRSDWNRAWRGRAGNSSSSRPVSAQCIGIKPFSRCIRAGLVVRVFSLVRNVDVLLCRHSNHLRRTSLLNDKVKMITFVAVLLLLLPYAKPDDFCSVDVLPPPRDPRQLMLSKELSDAEFAVIGNFISLHCCAASFHTVEWFKDQQPYPWPVDISTLIINPASHNQTIYTQAVSQTDSGRYHCVVSNEKKSLRHDVMLQVEDSFGSVSRPKSTYSPKNIYTSLGETARFYCEGYVGNNKLPDARNEIVWRKEEDNSSQPLSQRHTQRIIQREGKRVLGSYLTITDVQSNDLGRYVCTISNAGDQALEFVADLSEIYEQQLVVSDDTTLRVCLGVAFAVFSSIILLVTIYRCRLKLQVFWKNLRQELRYSDESQVDVVVLYHERDANTALSVIAPTLQLRYNCSCRQLQPLAPLSKNHVRCRRLLAIITSSTTGGVWSTRAVSDCVQRLLLLHSKVICLFLQELPLIDIKTEEGRRLKDLLSRVHYITSNEAQDKNFWTILQLGLPLQKKCKTKPSRESLENLV